MTMLTLMVAAAAALQPPVAPQFSRDNDVARAVSDGKQGAVVFGVYTDPRGVPLGCEVRQVFETDFGKAVCDQVPRMQFKAAIGRDGKPAYGYYRAIVNFYLPKETDGTKYPLQLTPDVSLTVKPVPKLLETKRNIDVAVEIDGKGTVSDCASNAVDLPAPLVQAACAQLKAQWTDAPLEDPEGTQRSYIRLLTVAFDPQG